MNRYDRYEDGIVIDKMSGENNLLDLVRVGDCVEDKYRNIYGIDSIRYEEGLYKFTLNYSKLFWHIVGVNRMKWVDISTMYESNIVAIWFRSGDTMKRYNT